MTPAIAERQVSILAALGQPTRLCVLTLVAAAGSQGLAAGEIARAMRCPASTLSFHLKELTQAGLLEARPRGRYVIYALRHAVLDELARFIATIGAMEPARTAAPRGRGVASRRPARRPRASDSDQLSMFGD
jgi:DNA-binding transcriptional ArsR family regulator